MEKEIHSEKRCCFVTYPTEEQEALMRKHRLNPDNWKVFEETKTKLIVLHKHKCMRKVLRKEIEE